METSYNGWSASRDPADFGGLARLVVAGEAFTPGVRAGDVATVLGYVAEQLHFRVEPVVRADWHQADDWGFSYRRNRNASNLSCHASGTAIDFNATRHPNGRRGTFVGAQVATIHAILTDCRGCVTWGGDFRGTPDEMHFEISAGPKQVAALATSIREERAAASRPAPAPLQAPAVPLCPALPAFGLPPGHYYGDRNGPRESHGGTYAWERPAIQAAQRQLIAKGHVPGQSDWHSGWADGLFEAATVAAVTRFQRSEMPRTTRFGELWADDWRQLGR